MKIKKDITKKENIYERFVEKFKKKSDGFTFIETLAVLAIGAILSAGCFFSASKIIDIAKQSAAKSQIKQYSTALQIYFLECGSFPTTEQGLAALWEKPILYPVPENWGGPYIDSKPTVDPWGSDFKYICAEGTPLPREVPENLPFILLSYGPDKAEGAEGENDDICSWK